MYICICICIVEGQSRQIVNKSSKCLFLHGWMVNMSKYCIQLQVNHLASLSHDFIFPNYF